MINSKKLRQLLAAAVFTVSFFSVSNVHAASYSVTQGDSLYLIGKLFNTTSSTLLQDNHLSSSTIYPGQVLSVPGTIYTVKSGDTLYLIAKRYNITLTSLRKMNNKWDDSLYIGQKLTLPASASVATSSTGTSTTVSAGTSSVSTSDVDLLARLITAEADGQPYLAKVAVGAVVLNRVKDSRFPSTISAVINEKSYGYYQFTPVENGYIYKPASLDSIKAANEALKGVDPTNGAVYYFDDSTTNSWLWSKPIALRIGKMVFTY